MKYRFHDKGIKEIKYKKEKLSWFYTSTTQKDYNRTASVESMYHKSVLTTDVIKKTVSED